MFHKVYEMCLFVIYRKLVFSQFLFIICCFFSLSDGRVLIPMVVKAVPMNLNTIYESFNESSVTEPFIRYDR
jgi:hypothetical protein